MQPDAFLCSVNDVKVSNTVDQRGRNVVTGAEVRKWRCKIFFPVFFNSIHLCLGDCCA